MTAAKTNRCHKNRSLTSHASAQGRRRQATRVARARVPAVLRLPLADHQLRSAPDVPGRLGARQVGHSHHYTDRPRNRTCSLIPRDGCMFARAGCLTSCSSVDSAVSIGRDRNYERRPARTRFERRWRSWYGQYHRTPQALSCARGPLSRLEKDIPELCFVFPEGVSKS